MATRGRGILRSLAVRLFLSLTGVAAVTAVAFAAVSVNVTTAGFAYLLLVLLVASYYGFVEGAVTSLAATLAYNFFFLPPVGEFTIADPQNWVALFSFLATALVASRLSDKAKRRTLDALESQRGVQRLYTFSRAILLIDESEPFPKQLVRRLADIFELDAVVLYERRMEEFFRAGPLDFEGMDDQLRDAALLGTTFSDAPRHRFIAAVRLGSGPIAGLALQGRSMRAPVLQGIANLVAIGMERARAQSLAAQIEAAKESDKLRNTLLDAMAHEFKTPLTSVMAATTSLLANPHQSQESRMEQVKIADEEVKRLEELINDTVEMGRLDSGKIDLRPEPSNVADIVREVVRAMHSEIDGRNVEVTSGNPDSVVIDRRLIRLAIKQLLDNALKYSPATAPVAIDVHNGPATVEVEITDHGEGIFAPEQSRIFQRLYRSPAVQRHIPGSGLGLSIAQNIARAHRGDVTVNSRPGVTTFRLTLRNDFKGSGS